MLCCIGTGTSTRIQQF